MILLIPVWIPNKKDILDALEIYDQLEFEY